MKFNIRNLAYLIIIVIGFGWLLFVGRPIILPILFSILFSIFLLPLTKFYHKKLRVYWLAIILSFLTFIVPVLGIFALFSFQLMDMIQSIPSITGQIEKGIDKLLAKLDSLNPFKKLDAEELITNNIDTLSDGPISTIGTGIISSSEILLSIALTFLYAFFILFYRESLKNFIIFQFARYKREDIKDTLLQIKETVQSYISGVGIVVLILSVVNSIGLYIIGIEYAIFWGTLAGILAIIPYIGTFLGGVLPFLYSLSTTDTSWQPIAILVFYGVVQQVEGNFITPNIVGNKVNINPLVAILSLIFFGSFWGIGGIILALPLISVIRIIMEQFDETRAISMLMSADIRSNAHQFRKLTQSSSDAQFLLPEDEGYEEGIK